MLSPSSQGGEGRQDPTPRKESQAQTQDMDMPWPNQVPGRLAARLTGGQEAGLCALPSSPPSSLEASILGWAGRPS